MRELNGSQIILETLIKHGIKEIFGYPGGSVIPFYDTLFRDFISQKKIRHILVRHEQAAAFAAAGHARITGKAAVCLATSGPGATNLVTGIADAMMDSVPMIAITGQVFSHLIGSDAFQETDAIGVMMPIVKHSYSIRNIEDLENALEEAFLLANTGRPGPVHIDITKDVFIAKHKYFGNIKPSIRGYQPSLYGNQKQINKSLDLIQNAKKPVVLIGRGAIISNAKSELEEFLKYTNFPAVSTLHGISAISSDHKNYISMLGMHGSVTANYAVYNSDLIISVGSRFDDRITGRLDDFSPNAKVIHIDIDPAELNKNVRTILPIVGDCKIIISAINELLKNNQINPENIQSWNDQIKEWQKEYPIDRGQKKQDHNNKMTAPDVLQILNNETNGEDIISADVGQHQMFVAQYYKFKKFRSSLFSGGLGSMGAGLPMAMGAKIATPEENVWSISGDGGFQMNLPEMATLKQDNINVKIVVLNNNFLGMVRQWQDFYHDKNYASTQMWNPNFKLLAESYDIPYFFADNIKDAETIIRKTKNMQETVFLEFLIAPEENVLPMVDAGASLKNTRVE